MADQSHLPRIDIRHSVASDNFSAALYSELANRTGVETYPNSPLAEDSPSSTTERPIGKPLRPNPHRLNSSRSRNSLKSSAGLVSPTSAHPPSPLPPTIHFSSNGRPKASLANPPPRLSPLSSPLPNPNPFGSLSHLSEEPLELTPGRKHTSSATSNPPPTRSGAVSMDSPRHPTIPPKPMSPHTLHPADRLLASAKTSPPQSFSRSLEFQRRYKANGNANPPAGGSTPFEPTIPQRTHSVDSKPDGSTGTRSHPTTPNLTHHTPSHEFAVPALPDSSDNPRNPFRPTPSRVTPAGGLSPIVKSTSFSLDEPPQDISDTSSMADLDPTRSHRDLIESLSEMDGGLSLLMDRTRQTLNSTKDVMSFLRRRALIEEAYCQNMLRLAQDMGKSLHKEEVREGTFRSAWCEIINLHEAVALNHIRFSNHLNEIADELNAQFRDKDRVRRQLKETASKQKKTLTEAEKSLDKFKEKYEHCSEDLEKVILKKKSANDSGARKNRSKSVSNTVAMILGRDSSVADLEKAEKEARNKVEHSNDAYKSQLSATNSARTDYFTVLLPSMLTALKSITEEGDLSLSLHLAKYSRAFENNIFADASIVKPLESQAGSRGLMPIVESIDNEGDMNEYFARMARQKDLAGSKSTDQLTLAASSLVGSSAGLLSPSTQAHLNSNLHAMHLASPRSASSVNNPASSYLSPQSKPPLLTLERQVGRDNAPVPRIVLTCTNFIEKYGVESEGIYRLSGQNSIVKQLKEELDTTGKVAEFDHLDQTFDVNNISSFLKLYFRELPDGLIPVRLYDTFVKIVENRDRDARKKSLRQALATLPKPNYDTLRHLILHLFRIQEHKAKNMMNTSNLSIVFGPTLVRAPDHINPISSMQMQCKIVEQILESCQELFSPSTSSDL